jgi:hypothetical protein
MTKWLICLAIVLAVGWIAGDEAEQATADDVIDATHAAQVAAKE